MLEFNNNHIITGHIKEVLSSFNLPKYRVYTVENQKYHDFAVEYNKTHEDKIPEERNIIATVKRNTKEKGFPEIMQYIPYIKDNKIQYYIYDLETKLYHWEDTAEVFSYNFKVLNMTKNLIIANNIYDYYTHEYLGNYLRFKRDYLNIDLMPLYNCFSDRVCSSLNYSWKQEEKQISFNTSNSSYKIYMLPVKLFKKYTIAIDCQTGVEVCCGIYGKYQDTRKKLAQLPVYTYKKYNNIAFSAPVVYDLLTTLEDQVSVTSLSNLALCEDDLKLFIKLPINNTSSIAVLEGDYRNYNDSVLNFVEKENNKTTLCRIQNYAVTNFDTSINDFSEFKPITPLQLLRLNTKKNYPFADRLIEYLTDNVITSDETISDNLKRVRKIVELNAKYADPNEKVWDAENKKLIRGKGRLRITLVPSEDLMWENKLRPILYEKFNNTLKANNNDTNHDILGYVDKDIEKWYRATTEDKKEDYITISAVDIYTDNNDLYNSVIEEEND